MSEERVCTQCNKPAVTRRGTEPLCRGHLKAMIEHANPIVVVSIHEERDRRVSRSAAALGGNAFHRDHEDHENE